MNKILLAAGGGVAGGILGYLIADYIAYMLDERAFYAEIEEEEIMTELEQKVGGMDKELYDFEEGDNDKTDYTKKTKKLIDQKPKLEELVRPYQEEKEPYVMTAEEWEETMSGYERHTILYYEMDGVYCNDQEEIIDDPKNMFVPNAFLHFGEGSEDPDVVYIANPHRSEMYEILRMKASYQVDVLGESPPEETPKKGRTRKRSGSQATSKTKKEAEELGGEDDPEPNE